ncbi:MAG: FHA domain-containing protein [Calothrix sp. FI2-JRJ7]|jgi:methylglyoxal synthase|nr:FHA domain-containing protein [Calothrix sp. FI2-JRJ7]
MKVKVSTFPAQSEFEEVDLSLTTRRGSECLIGRSPDSDLVLDSTDVSRVHGKFFAQGGNYYFCDVGSRNGSIVNGKLAEKDHSYKLKDGDIIRIGDFVLMMEDEIPDTYQAETVVRIINPSVFSNWQKQNVSAAPQEPQLTDNEPNNQPVAPIAVAEEVSPDQEEREKQEIVNTSSEVEQNFEPALIASDDVAIPTLATDIHETNKINEINQTHELEDDIASSVVEETEDVAELEPLEAPHIAEYTIVQVSDVDNNIASSVIDETENVAELEPLEAPHLVENTEVQVRDADNNIASSVIDETENVAELEPLEAPHLVENTEVQVRDADNNIASSVIDETENVAELENLEAPHIAEATEQTHDISGNEFTDSAEPIHQDEEESEDTPPQQVEAELVSEASIIAPELNSEEVIATSQETEEVEELQKSPVQVAKIIEEKQIVLIAHDSKKSELVELVSEHGDFLSYCLTRTWQTFSDDLYKQTGLSVTQEIPPATSGGYQAINSLVNSGEILAVIFLRDLMMGSQPGQASEEALLRICNINNVLLATNLPTAKAILYYLKNLKD